MSDLRLGDIALAMARAGLHVFPCKARTKVPATRNGHHAATRNATKIFAWWTANPEFNIGINTQASGLVVIDCDAGKPWPENPPITRPPGVNNGADLLMVLADTRATELWNTPIVQTPSGGTHFYYRHKSDQPIKSSAGVIGPWIDVRAHGGYVVGPFSELDHGSYTPVHGWFHQIAAEGFIRKGGRLETSEHRFTALTVDPMPLPRWIADFATVPAESATVISDPVQRALAAIATATPSSGRGYAATALHKEVQRVEGAVHGVRNHTLNSASYSLGTLVGAGQLEESDVREALTAAALSIGLDEAETYQTITSGIRAGLKNPRSVA